MGGQAGGGEGRSRPIGYMISVSWLSDHSDTAIFDVTFPVTLVIFDWLT